MVGEGGVKGNCRERGKNGRGNVVRRRREKMMIPFLCTIRRKSVTDEQSVIQNEIPLCQKCRFADSFD